MLPHSYLFCSIILSLIINAIPHDISHCLYYTLYHMCCNIFYINISHYLPARSDVNIFVAESSLANLTFSGVLPLIVLVQ